MWHTPKQLLCLRESAIMERGGHQQMWSALAEPQGHWLQSGVITTLAHFMELSIYTCCML